MGIRIDWSKLDVESPQGLAKFQNAANTILRQADRFAGNRALAGALQHFTVTGDIPNVAQEIVDAFHERQDFDRGYEELFKIHDMSQAGQDHFNIGTVSEGFTFDEMVEGARVELKRWTASKTAVYVRTFADAVGWTGDTFRYRKLLDIQQGLADLEAAHEAKKASVHYGLIEAVPDQDGVDVDVAYQTATEDTAPYNDALTIQTACAEIDAALADSGMQLSAASPFYVVARRSSFAYRLTRALNTMNQAVQGSPTLITYNVRPLFTNQIASTSYYYVVLPGHKLQTGYWRPLEIKFGGDTLSDMEYARGLAQYSCACGEVDQIRRCATS